MIGVKKNDGTCRMIGGKNMEIKLLSLIRKHWQSLFCDKNTKYFDGALATNSLVEKHIIDKSVSSIYWFNTIGSILERLPDPEYAKWTADQRNKIITAITKVLDLYIDIDDIGGKNNGSESALAKEWDTTREDEAWQYLSKKAK
jgi:hypothetical protein